MILRREGLDGARLTRLANPAREGARPRLAPRVSPQRGAFTAAMGPGDACAELLADLLLLGMESVALADALERLS